MCLPTLVRAQTSVGDEPPSNTKIFFIESRVGGFVVFDQTGLLHLNADQGAGILINRTHVFGAALRAFAASGAYTYHDVLGFGARYRHLHRGKWLAQLEAGPKLRASFGDDFTESYRRGGG